MIKKCEICGREFAAQRSTARFCSATCRKRNQRGYAYEGETLPPVPSASMSDDEVLATIQRAHQCASDLSRASLMTSAPLCLSLRAIAVKFEQAMREEGL